jgi:hypothetical protein
MTDEKFIIKNLEGKGRGLIEVVSQNLLEEVRKAMKQSGKPMSRPRFQTNTSRI